jgi:hypothetical protein
VFVATRVASVTLTTTVYFVPISYPAEGYQEQVRVDKNLQPFNCTDSCVFVAFNSTTQSLQSGDRKIETQLLETVAFISASFCLRWMWEKRKN